MTKENTGKVVGVRGQLVQIEFKYSKPSQYELILLADDQNIRMQLYSSAGSDRFYAIALNSVSKIYRGAEVIMTGKPILFPVGPEMLGRVVDIFGDPKDGGAPIKTQKHWPIHKLETRADVLTHTEILETGIKALDLFAPMIKGGKMGLFGGAGVGKTILLTEILHNVVGRKKDAVSIFAGIGERSREGHELYHSLRETKSLSSTSLVYGPMGANPAVRFLSAFSAATLAEYFRDVEKKEVLFFIDNIYRFAQAGNEISTLTKTIPSEDGYQATLESEMAHFHERLVSVESGILSAIEAVYVPADDLLDQGVQSIFPYLDTTVVLSREIFQQGRLPAIDFLSSTSSILDPEIVGLEHYDISLKAKTILKKADSLERIVSLVGEAELSGEDQLVYKRANKIKNYMTQNFFVSQGQKNTTGVFVPITQTVADVKAILEGKLDHVPEENMMFIGDLKNLIAQNGTK